MPRLASLPMTISLSVLTLNSLSAVSLISVFLQNDFPFAALEIEAVGQFLFGLVDGVLDFHRVDLRNNVE